MKKILLVILGLIIAGSIAFYADRSMTSPVQVRSGGITNLSGLNITPVSSTDTFSIGATANPGVSIDRNGTITQNTLAQYVSATACNTASSTLFAVLPPAGATSTATVIVTTSGTAGNATSSSLLVGTSTKSVGLASTDVSPTLINATVATSAPVFLRSGVTVGSIGNVTAGASTYSTIFVNPTDLVVGYSTSTYGGSGSIGYNPGLSGCTYKILWNN